MPHLDVDYYDDEERALFDAGPHASPIYSVVRGGLDISFADLLAASMFMEQKEAPGWWTRDDLRRHAMDRVAEFADYFSVDAHGLIESVAANFRPSETPVSQIERIGVGASIATMDAIFGTHGADWEKIPVANKKDLDFSIASLGGAFVAVESKGTLVWDASKKDGLSGHKASIKNKKVAQAGIRSNAYLVGAITAVPPIGSGQVCKVWLVDPPLTRLFESPSRFKLLARLRAYEALLRLVGRPQLLLALSNRINALQAIAQVEELDGVALKSTSGEPLGAPVSAKTTWSGALDLHAGVVTLKKRELVYIGMALETMELLGRQDQKAITLWKQPSRLSYRKVLSVRLRDVVPSRDSNKMRSNEKIDIEFTISEASSGLVVGMAPVPAGLHGAMER